MVGTEAYLLYQKPSKPLLFVIREPRYAEMWRIMRPDGQLSDFTNLTRAKDAARAIAERDISIDERDTLLWKETTVETARRLTARRTQAVE
jgi:hypothetical protein